jgi:hypothetical protein
MHSEAIFLADLAHLVFQRLETVLPPQSRTKFLKVLSDICVVHLEQL